MGSWAREWFPRARLFNVCSVLTSQYLEASARQKELRELSDVIDFERVVRWPRPHRAFRIASVARLIAGANGRRW